MIFVFDLGTTSLKAALFHQDGRIIGTTSVPLGFEEVAHRQYREVEPRRWIQGLKTAYAGLSGGEKLPLKAVVACGNGPTLVAVDREGNPLRNAMSWMDRRGTVEAETIRKEAGYYVDPTFYLPKALWMRNNEPALFSRVASFLACPEYVSLYLTGRAVTVLPGDNFLRYFWTDELLEALGLQKELFPEFVHPGTTVGNILPGPARELGLPEGIPVFTGGPDFVMSLVGTGTVFPGRACDRAGTSEGINLCTATLIRDERLMGYGHVVKGLYNVSGIISTSGKALEWTLGTLGMAGKTYDELFALAAKSPRGSRGLLFLPYLTGERAPHWDPSLRAGFFGLTLAHGPGELLRSVLESVGFAMRDVLEVIEENGITVEDMRITGNPSRSDFWNRVKADITGKPILVPEMPESELLGNACVALTGIGRYGNLQEAAEKIVHFKERIEPDEQAGDFYTQLFQHYREFCEQTKELAHTLSHLQMTEES
ncbi:MAG: hypothetical protein JW760_07415 [Spirochaetales bacterium]|nr:hypothetical protein [Spirochaetales bacterium]